MSRYLILVKMASKDTEAVVNALLKHAHKLAQQRYKSLTWDRGTEMSGRSRFTPAGSGVRAAWRFGGCDCQTASRLPSAAAAPDPLPWPADR